MSAGGGLYSKGISMLRRSFHIRLSLGKDLQALHDANINLHIFRNRTFKLPRNARHFLPRQCVLYRGCTASMKISRESFSLLGTPYALRIPDLPNDWEESGYSYPSFAHPGRGMSVFPVITTVPGEARTNGAYFGPRNG